jgi:hypothetical protein
MSSPAWKPAALGSWSDAVRTVVIVPPEISRAIRGFGLGREALVELLNGIRRELEQITDNHRLRRHPLHPDFYFWFGLTVWEQGRPRGFRFTVDDARATDRLFIV